MEFDPSRFLNSDGHVVEQDPRNFMFGFGRRICPGRFLAEASVFLAIAKSTAVFNIGQVVEDGVETETVVGFLPGIISHPADYKLSITSRGPSSEKLIRKVEDENPWEKGDSQALDEMDY